MYQAKECEDFIRFSFIFFVVNFLRTELIKFRFSEDSTDSIPQSTDDSESNLQQARRIQPAHAEPLVSDILNQTAEQAERARIKAQTKADNMSTFGWQAFTVEASYKAYEKSLKKLPTASLPSGAIPTAGSLEENPLEYGKANAKVSKHALDRFISVGFDLIFSH